MKRPKIITKYEKHKRLYMLIQGAVIDAFNAHPDYLQNGKRSVAITSITKRVAGLIINNLHLVKEFAPDDSLK